MTHDYDTAATFFKRTYGIDMTPDRFQILSRSTDRCTAATLQLEQHPNDPNALAEHEDAFRENLLHLYAMLPQPTCTRCGRTLIVLPTLLANDKPPIRHLHPQEKRPDAITCRAASFWYNDLQNDLTIPASWRATTTPPAKRTTHQQRAPRPTADRPHH